MTVNSWMRMMIAMRALTFVLGSLLVTLAFLGAVGLLAMFSVSMWRLIR